MGSNSKMQFPSQKEFKASACRQCFSLPDSIIYNISKNPKLAKIYQKLSQTCKYFFLKNPILLFHCLEIVDKGWAVCSDQIKCDRYVSHKAIKWALIQRRSMDLSILSNCKIWVTHQIGIFSTKSNFASKLIPKIFQYDAQLSALYFQNLTLDQFLFYSRNVTGCDLRQTVISFKRNSEVPFEEIIASLPNITDFSFQYHSKNISSDTVKNLLQIPHFKNIKTFYLNEVSQNFDITAFYEYYKTTKSSQDFEICFNRSVSQAYKRKLEEIVDNELEDTRVNRTAPLLQLKYDGLSHRKESYLFLKKHRYF